MENRFHAQHLLPRAADKITNDYRYVASIYEAYQADIDLSLEDSRREVASGGFRGGVRGACAPPKIRKAYVIQR